MSRALARALPWRVWRPLPAALPWLALLLLWWCWRLEPFHGVGMTTQDQVTFSTQGTAHFWDHVFRHAKAQGRVYFLLTKILDLWLAARPELPLVQAINLGSFALSAWCFAYAVFRDWQRHLLYMWLFGCLAWTGFSHLPPAAYPSVNHLPLVSVALAAYGVRRASALGRERPLALLIGFAVLAFLAFFQYEPVALLSLCVLAWVVYTEPSPALRRRLWFSLGSALALYVALYVGWRLRFPSSYSGVLPGEFSLWNVVRVTVAYTVGGLPFCTAYSHHATLLWGDPIIGLVKLPFAAPAPGAFGLFGVLLTLLATAALVRLYQPVADAAANSKARPAWAWWLFVAVLVVAINGPLGISRKYQGWVKDWDESYLTSQLAFYPIVLAATVGFDWVYRCLRWRGLALPFAVLMLASALVSLPVRAHNVLVGARQRGIVARWDALAALAAYTPRIQEVHIAMPDLFYAVGQGSRDWSTYWSTYFQQRFSYWFYFHAAPPPGLDDIALVRAYFYDDGGFRALSVQTSESVALIATPTEAPPVLVSDAGRALALDWSEAELLAGSGYVALTLKKPPQLVGIGRRIEPAWVFPSMGLEPKK